MVQSTTDESSPPVGLATALRERTAQLHTQAERSGVIAAILEGTVTRLGYAVYLRNLLPAYRALEQALQRHLTVPGLAFLAQPSLHRAVRIEADLAILAGQSWPSVLPLLPAGQHYAERVRWAGTVAVELLHAHAYTRYLGDLFGGQTMRRRLVRQFGPDFDATAFTAFPEITDLRGFTAGFRAALDEAGRLLVDAQRVIDEAAVAFQLNIALSEEVAALHSP